MFLIAVEAVPAESKPQAAVRVRISAGERRGFGAAAPLSVRASFLEQGRAGGLVESCQTNRVEVDLGRGAIPTYRSICFNVIHTIASRLV